jgi:AbiTii
LKLLDEIIDALSSQDSSLTDALLKTKVLLHKIGRRELVEWVNHELNGYTNTSEIPKYRILNAQVLGNLANMAYLMQAHPIPIGHLSKEQRGYLENAKMYQPLAVLEKLVDNDGQSLQLPIDMEFNPLLGESLGAGFTIQRAWSSISQADMAQIFVQVRSRLLDFVLGLKDQLGDDVSEQEIKQRTDSIDTSSLFNNAIFGNNTTIVVGNNNSQNIKNTIIRGDFTALAEHLSQAGVRSASIAELERAIEQDKAAPEIGAKQFGPSVKAWLKDMLSKAVDTSWNVELGIASSLLATALQKYYGWP